MKRGWTVIFLIPACALSLASGCASSGPVSGERERSARIDEGPAGPAGPPPLVEPVSEAAANRPWVVRGVELENTEFDIPVRINTRVEHWVEYFTGRGHDVFARYLERSEYFIPYIREILRDEGMPEDLVYLAMIESGFNNHARSRASAVGPWQFISATGRRYGLAVNWWVDERRDIRKSTLAAIRYLRDLHKIFGSWELAWASYNAGETKVSRAIRRFQTLDFWTLARHRFLRPETRNYVPKLMAAAIVSKNRTQFGFKPSLAARLREGETLAADGSVVNLRDGGALAELETAVDEEPIERLPGFLMEFEDAYFEDGLKAAVLIGAEAGFDRAPAGRAPAAAVRVLTPHVSRRGEVGGEALLEFEVQSPADLNKIARASGLSYDVVRRLNPELRQWCTPPRDGTYRIKLPASVERRFLLTYNHPAFPREIRFRRYRVRKGDSLPRVARRFRVDQDAIRDLNGLSRRARLRAGRMIRLPLRERGRRHALIRFEDRLRNLAILRYNSTVWPNSVF